ncbi:hypothetical protein ISCGN_000226 [Ixodes scapularis]
MEDIHENVLQDLQRLLELGFSENSSNRDEILALKSRMERLTTKVCMLEPVSRSLKARARALVGLLAQERESHDKALLEKHKENVRLRLEIAKYRELLKLKEAEESQLHIAPRESRAGNGGDRIAHTLCTDRDANGTSSLSCPSPSGAVVRNTPPVQGTKRKLTCLSPLEEQSNEHDTASTKGDLEMSDHCPGGRCVVIKNNGTKVG